MSASQPKPSHCCPVCASTQNSTIYAIDSLPVHSVKLTHSASDSLAAARARLELLLCSDCGMIWNHEFQPDLMSYDGNYEETQAFSAEFTKFQMELAKSLVKEANLVGKTVIEIGCGKGEYLTQLCAQGVAKGIGFDPSFDASRVAAQAELQFFTEFFPPPTALALPTQADAYVSKMTLEHIPAPGDFVSKLRATIGDKPALVSVQVPAAERIIAELAYWDIYYEHCNYFNQTSLKRLFETNGFATISCCTVFGDQYLSLLARAVDSEQAPQRHQHAPPIQFLSAARDFQSSMNSQLQSWRAVLDVKRILIWGAASKAVALLQALPEIQTRVSLVDINPNKHSSFLPATTIEIQSPEAIAGQAFDLILIANPIYRNEICTQLDQLNVSGERHDLAGPT